MVKLETAADLKSKSKQRSHGQEPEPKQSGEVGPTLNIHFNKLSMFKL